MAIVRGGCHGIGFTMLSGIDFIYCSPDAVFQTPFMASMQTLEGSSSITFPMQFGYRKAREILMLDKPIRASEAVDCNFANGIIDDLGGEFFDIEKVPAIGKMLNTDYRTLMEAKRLLSAARDME